MNPLNSVLLEGNLINLSHKSEGEALALIHSYRRNKDGEPTNLEMYVVAPAILRRNNKMWETSGGSADVRIVGRLTPIAAQDIANVKEGEPIQTRNLVGLWAEHIEYKPRRNDV